MTIDAKRLLREARENQERLSECVRHRFDDKAEVRAFGQTFRCLECGGVMAFVPDILRYVEGYRAAGGDPNDIIPGAADDAAFEDKG